MASDIRSIAPIIAVYEYRFRTAVVIIVVSSNVSILGYDWWQCPTVGPQARGIEAIQA